MRPPCKDFRHSDDTLFLFQHNMDGINSHVAHHAENGVISGRCTPDQRRTERNKGNTVTSCTSSYVLLYELRIRARVTRLAKFTIDLSVVEPEVAGRDAILSQKAAVHALCKYGKRFGGGGGRGGGRCFPRLRSCKSAALLLSSER